MSPMINENRNETSKTENCEHEEAQWTMNNEQWTLNNEQRTMNNEQWTMNNIINLCFVIIAMTIQFNSIFIMQVNLQEQYRSIGMYKRKLKAKSN